MITQITTADALPLRQSVLWPGFPPEHAMVPGDETALHFGAYRDGTLVAVGSLFQDGTALQLRKLATLPQHQGNGHGSALIRHMIAHAKAQHTSRLWCDARVSAIPFYEKLGFHSYGAPFDKKGRPYQKMQIALSPDAL